MIVRDALIELLAIKLYEHDQQDGYWPPKNNDRATSWARLAEDDREEYRVIARGLANYGSGPDETTPR